jgi:2-hydroxy-3-keto-5-methylthiopentenyl-1-phosphate phosphatase
MTEPAAVVLLDFDGTVTRRDATDAILEAFADPRWLAIEDDWLTGRIGSRDCLQEQMALVSSTPDQVDRLLDGIDLDEGFVRVLEVCATWDLPVHIISDGFDYCIERILGRPSERLGPMSFPHPSETCPHGCATCKPAAMAALNPTGAPAIFVGDGLSDRHAALCADIVFAKSKLAAFCEGASVPYTPFDGLASVAGGLDTLLRHGLERRPVHRKAAPV